ncbi:MAG: redox-regulated ATPase YchF [Oligoflexales bacterium]|nr:redox-regulated ATPase YchF [Oligoflexales bacterium]
MKAALAGLAYSGKTSIFKALTSVDAGKKDESIGSIKVPDERIDFLCSVYHPKKTTYAEFILTDLNVQEKSSIIPAKTKSIIQKSELLILVLRNFDSVMTESPRNPLAEYNKLMDEIVITDFIVIENRLERQKKEQRKLPEQKILEKLHFILGENRFPGDEEISGEEMRLLNNYNFLSLKKCMVLINQPEGETEIPSDLEKKLCENNMAYFPISAALECELNELSRDEQVSFLESYGLKETGKERFIREAYRTMGLISFLTCGEDECRAWPIKSSSKAVDAASRIHSDIARGFIRAETISFDDFKRLGSEAECKKAGLYRLEGKEYIVKDGDIINFRFNV